MRKTKLTREEKMIENNLEHFVPVDKKEKEYARSQAGKILA